MSKGGLSMQLVGKVAIVTGAGSGIGRAVAVRFAGEGASVVAAGRTLATVEETAAAIVRAGGAARAVAADVGNSRDVRQLVEAAVEAYGRLDVLVNNAGVGGPGKPLADTSDEEWDRVIDTNLRGCFLCMREAWPHLRGGGAIVNISSVLAEATLPGCTAYTASKAAIIGLTRAAALEMAGDGVRVNCILPGSIDTPMMWEGLDQVGRRTAEMEVAKAAPLNRVGDPDEIARVALFLVGDGSAFMTGAPVLVDGGLMTRSPAPR
jgi:NAD(P)-dependent dehydrogenase (short-subunit alcohol dehydrogenase family)